MRRKAYELAQTIFGLTRLGRLAESARVLSVGAGHEPLDVMNLELAVTLRERRRRPEHCQRTLIRNPARVGGLKVNRAATAWLIRRFIDPDAVFVFAIAGDVAAEATRRHGLSFHAAGATYPARDAAGRTPFDVLVETHCANDPALRLMSTLIKDADVPHAGQMPEAAGLRLISAAFPLLTSDDSEIITRSAFMYDALYAALQRRAGTEFFRSTFILRVVRFGLECALPFDAGGTRHGFGPEGSVNDTRVISDRQSSGAHGARSIAARRTHRSRTRGGA